MWEVDLLMKLNEKIKGNERIAIKLRQNHILKMIKENILFFL